MLSNDEIIAPAFSPNKCSVIHYNIFLSCSLLIFFWKFRDEDGICNARSDKLFQTMVNGFFDGFFVSQFGID